MRIITIIGARPQFIKAAMLSQAIRQRQAEDCPIQEKILHTGQHYDYEMSDIFFTELGIPAPAWHLGCSTSVDEMVQNIIPILQEERPDMVVVYGDTNSTLAGALAASHCNIPIAHIEAGLRSYTDMAEEHNRVATDRLAHWLFCPTSTAVDNLHKEGITQRVYQVGDIMYDAAIQVGLMPSSILDRLDISAPYLLATVHRAENTDRTERLAHILTAFARLNRLIILPLHPRTRKVISAHPELQQLLQQAANIRVIDSVGYADIATLEKNAYCILTDSGGIQKEAYFHRTPCITLREETEWVETVQTGWNTLVGTDIHRILSAVNNVRRPQQEITEYGSGTTARQIVDILCAF
ncbi:MAG: UDP-N-acetylglucosamine 2-epimerase (non-hydrolyzing) [Paludibacteraceae bacterium]|nr:UDP-N-acetylglucosamine 2-epimerase (non-hydrolyzing) [Paludibacteraceae bacterium]